MKSNNLFKIIPNNFFNLLTNNHQEIYIDILFLLLDNLYKGNAYGIEKSKIIALLMNKVSKKKAINIIQNLKKHGWIYEYNLKNNKEIIDIPFYALSILNTLNNLNKDIEYNASLYTIYLALKNLNNNNLKDIFEEINLNVKMLMNMLITLNINIKKYIEKLINQQYDNNIKNYITCFLLDYQKQIIDKNYKILKTRDNLNKYRPYIISKLNAIITDSKKYPNIFTDKEKIYQQIKYIISSLNYLEIIIKEIDYNNSYYINKAITKIVKIINKQDDNCKKLTKIINYLSKNEKEINIINESFHFYPYSFLTINSLYTMPKKEDKKDQIIKKKKSLNDFEKYKYYQKVFRNKTYNKDIIILYVKKFLNTNTEIYASKLPLNNIEDYIKLIFIYLYSQNDYYYIVKTNKVFNDNGFYFYDFIIRRSNSHGQISAKIL